MIAMLVVEVLSHVNLSSDQKLRDMNVRYGPVGLTIQ